MGNMLGGNWRAERQMLQVRSALARQRIHDCCSLDMFHLHWYRLLSTHVPVQFPHRLERLVDASIHPQARIRLARRHAPQPEQAVLDLNPGIRLPIPPSKLLPKRRNQGRSIRDAVPRQSAKRLRHGQRGRNNPRLTSHALARRVLLSTSQELLPAKPTMVSPRAHNTRRSRLFDTRRSVRRRTRPHDTAGPVRA